MSFRHSDKLSDLAWDVYRRLAGLYCTVAPEGHDWGTVKLTIAGNDEGFHQPVLWKPKKVCRRCRSFKVKVGFPDASNNTRDASDIHIEGEESSTVIVSDWDA